ncbi:PREDICTED: bile salt-activated lipase [Myotis davidii]|uniref:bile salt-activated lipase n=1 Tax=Myotis davidii TaxID=225400 RepID=UPI00076794CF|nr:PREDICTED: bile salt-activated lipase [Myotis davidii]
MGRLELAVLGLACCLAVVSAAKVSESPAGEEGPLSAPLTRPGNWVRHLRWEVGRVEGEGGQAGEALAGGAPESPHPAGTFLALPLLLHPHAHDGPGAAQIQDARELERQKPRISSGTGALRAHRVTDAKHKQNPRVTGILSADLRSPPWPPGPSGCSSVRGWPWPRTEGSWAQRRPAGCPSQPPASEQGNSLKQAPRGDGEGQLGLSGLLPVSVSQNLPVMIWIYGGAFVIGSGQGLNFLSDYMYDGEEIATRGNVIVVTFSYRVGPLGYLSTGDANLPGNYGLWDQHMAIAWVKRNIAAFGGDPDNITIFGESAGGASVSLQVWGPREGEPSSQVIGGSWGESWAAQALELSRLHVRGQAEDPGLDHRRKGLPLVLGSGSGALKGVRTPALQADPLLYYLGLMPVVDGDFIPDDPINLFANAADIDYIAGTNDMDGHIFASIDLPAINVALLTVTGEDFFKLVSGFTIAKGPRGANATFDFYTAPWAQDSSKEAKKKTVVEFETDVLFLMPTKMAVAQHKANAKSARTYTYLFSHPSRMPVYPKWVGADHADDLQYVFGKPFATPLGYRAQDRTVSQTMIAYWTNFARTGDPNQGHSAVPTQWEPYTQENGNYLEINNKMDGQSMKQHLRSSYLQYWTQTYQALPTVNGDVAGPVPALDDSEAIP